MNGGRLPLRTDLRFRLAAPQERAVQGRSARGDRIYIGCYEKVTDSLGNIVELHYISGGNEFCR